MTIDPIGDGDWNYEESNAVMPAVERIIESDKPMCEWMTRDLSDQVLSAITAAHTFIQMGYLRQGFTQEQAKEAANRQALLLAFDLGLKAGKEVEAGRAFREMFGGAE